MAHKTEDTLLEAIEPLGGGPSGRTPTPAEGHPVHVERTPTAIEPGTGGSQATGGFQPFRPMHRPSVLLVCVLDDGANRGELIRVRSERFVVGRSGGDCVIPHDNAISGEHFELVRGLEDGESCWVMKDLGSTNGTFVAVADYALKHNQTVLIGGRRYRFAKQSAESREAQADPPQRQVTGAFPKYTGAFPAAGTEPPAAVLVELAADGNDTDRKLELTRDDQTVGTDPRLCSVVIEDDPFVEPRHARIFRDKQGGWRIENLSSSNGTWLKMDELRIARGALLQAGEQRFQVKVL